MANAATARAFQYGLGIFALTALIGLANAIKIFGTIDQNTLLTHLHSGTLGWITMGVFGIAVALFARNGSAVGPNVTLSALATAAYVLAFWSGNSSPAPASDSSFSRRSSAGGAGSATVPPPLGSARPPARRAPSLLGS